MFFLRTTLNGSFTLCSFIERARSRFPYAVCCMLGVSREAAMQTCDHSTQLDFVVILFIARMFPMQVTTGETDSLAHRSRFVLCKKKRPRWSQLQGRWFPASLLMKLHYAFRFLPKREHSETETCPESTSKGTLCIFKLTVEKNLIYCGSGSKHNPCCANSKTILVTIIKTAVIIATTITFCFLGM